MLSLACAADEAEQAQKEETNVKKFETRNIDGKAIAAQATSSGYCQHSIPCLAAGVRFKAL